MSHEILPMSHCKTCKELAEDCECIRGTDRLLSYDEKLQAINACRTRQDYENCIAAAQLAKTDKEWVEWVSKAGYVGIVSRGLPSEYIYIPVEALEERRKEIGL